MIPGSWSSDALAHGGEDHGAPAPEGAAADRLGVASWSSEFDAVLRTQSLSHGGPGSLLVADHRTSAPIATGSATIDFRGPVPATFEATSTERPGHWTFDGHLDGAGPWSAGVTVLTTDRSDALGFPEFTLADDEAGALDAHVAIPWCAAAAGALAGLAVGLVFGAVSGRRLAAALGGLMAALLAATSPQPGFAHGGEDHSARAPAPSAVGSGPVLSLESQFLIGLRTEVARRAEVGESVRALGTTVPRPGGAAFVRAPVSGVLSFPEDRVLVPGEAVRAGDVLGSLTELLAAADRSAWIDARTSARVDLARAREDLALAERDVARSEGLGAVLSEREQTGRRAAVEVAREAVRQAQTAVAATDGARPTTVLRAPIDGRITALAARPGDVVSAGDVLLRVTAGEGAWVEATVPETWAGALRVGDPATVTADARPEVALDARVLDPGLEADPTSGALRIVLALAEPVDFVVPGMTVTATVTAGADREALVIPDDAVVDGVGEVFVFVKTAPERFELRPIRPGRRSGELREVIEGIEVGERVVVSGTYALRSIVGR